MNLYQVEITTEIDTECILINANDENEAISIAQYMLENGEIDFAIGHEIINITHFLLVEKYSAYRCCYTIFFLWLRIHERFPSTKP